MSVLQRAGSFFPRRLSKLYSQTKKTYETATVTLQTEHNPDVASLQREYRIQKDRLLAWGLDWSDSDTAQFPDVQIDDSVDQAGCSDVVAYIMSTIQDLLVESEKLQTSLRSPDVESTDHELPGSFSLKDAQENAPSTSTWSNEQLQKSRALLEELTACIDYLFKLSETRRAQRKGSREMSVSKESFINDLEQLRKRPSFQSEYSERTLVNDGLLVDNTSPSPARHIRTPIPSVLDSSPLQSSPSPGEDSSAVKAQACATILKVNSDAIQIQSGPIADGTKPPTYDAAVGTGVARSLAVVDGEQLSADEKTKLGVPESNKLQIIIETTPITEWSKTVPSEEQISKYRRLSDVKDGMDGIQSNAPRMLGYTMCPSIGQHVTIYQLPSIFQHEGTQTPGRSSGVEALNTLFSTGADSTDVHMPSLEDRFRLAFGLVTAVLHFQQAKVRHGNINSSNIALLSVKHPHYCKYRSPLLLSQLDLRLHSEDSMDKEPFPTKIYRHPQEQIIDDETSSWACDTYSLGLVLLEIGLWTPLRRLWKQKYDSETFKSRIRNVYAPKLASRCGSAYMKAVQACLDAVDVQRTDNEPVAPLAYMVTILNIMGRCCAIDLEGPPTAPVMAYFQKLALEERPSAVQTDDLNRSEVIRNLPLHSAEIGVEEATRTEQSSLASPTADSHGAVPKTYLKKWDTIDIPQNDLDLWNNVLMPRLSKLLQNILGNSVESCSASLMMVGLTPDTAKTTICIQCTSVELVRKMLKKHFKCKSGWGLVVLRGDVQRCGRHRKEPRKAKAQAASTDKPKEIVQIDSYYQQKPCGGASIGAYRDYEHLPPVSFGGALMVGGELYGMTVHHMLDKPEEEESAHQAVQRSAAAPHFAMEDFSYIGSGSDVADDLSTLHITEDEALDLMYENDEEKDFWFSDMAELTEDDGESDDVDFDDASSVGDVSGIDPADGDNEDLIVTQPAIDDVEDDFFPSLEDRDDDHLSSHTLGYVHASSGIRRITRKGLKHEVDWALIKINTDRVPENNTFAHPSTTAESNAIKTTVLKIAPESSLPKKSVLCQGRTSGLQSGRISPALSLLKFHGRTSFSSSWCVDGGFGVPGDSGAWVVDPVERSLCGHVLAWGNRSKIAFIASMEVLMEDMERVLGQSVGLPDAVGFDAVEEDVASKRRTDEGFIQAGTSSSSSTTTTEHVPRHPSSTVLASTSSQNQTTEPLAHQQPSPNSTQVLVSRGRRLPKLESPRGLPLMMH
ncbi:putative serine threonine protein kinase [Phaeomoniella chlamydospora]|uniref:Putative serine threonine protein kinase n=1 Tax=Phaeomoniella chlamydospora TaxID=158046 RepID=A0A0G2ENG6_PHACM|nr:putative serine threonine protein kinase [Phaeomoniella chlamydospora]